MGHNITAIITLSDIDLEISKKYDLPVFTHNKCSIIALNASHSDYWSEQLSIENESNNEIILNCPITHFFSKTLNLDKYAIIDTEYFGGTGEQWAVLFNKGKVVIPESKGSINLVLRELGVKCYKNSDEFDSISLGKYRAFDDLFEKYWE